MAAAFICRRYILNDAEIADTFDKLDMDRDVHMEASRKELDFIFSEMDRDKSGKINKESFVNYLRSPPINSFTVSQLEQQFMAFDSDGDGLITQDELQGILEKIADLNDPEAVSQLFTTTDVHHHGRISFREFIKMMTE
uniref:EF-hand domain-containing protein n=1 Tax=Ditylenchus dipsaci TaxID=166011 RepID=A0A915DBT5_9BILA